MQIIFGKDNAKKLGEKYTVLELETVVKDGVVIEAYCLVPAEKTNLAELPKIDYYKDIHAKFVEAYKHNDYESLSLYYQEVKGIFNGELDSYYDEIVSRMKGDKNV